MSVNMGLTKFSVFYRRKTPAVGKLLACGLVACLFLGSLSGCSTANSLLGGNSRKEAVAEIAWEFAKNAVQMEIEADGRLNEYDGQAHTLLLGVYQMEDSALFYKLAADSSLLAKSFEPGKGSDAFIQFDRYVISPGQRTIVTLDRAQKARFVAIAAGYYGLDASATRLFQVPLSVVSDGLLTKTYKAAPAPLALRLNLGASGIVNAQRLNQDPAAKPVFETVPLDGGGKEISVVVQDIQNGINAGRAARKLDK
jgi:type VI secretion system VasD/TssJ family lipoprotein